MNLKINSRDEAAAL
jgi:hypothetical protein